MYLPALLAFVVGCTFYKYVVTVYWNYS